MKASGNSNSSGRRVTANCSEVSGDHGLGLLLAGRRNAHPGEERWVRHGRRRAAGCDPVRCRRDVGVTGGLEDLAHVLLVTEGERTDRALPGRRCPGCGHEWPEHRAHVPRVPFDALPAGEDQAARRRQPPSEGAQGPGGLVEEHDPELAGHHVEEALIVLRRLHIRLDEARHWCSRCRRLGYGRARAVRLRCRSRSPRPREPRRTASARVSGPAPQPTSQTLQPGRAAITSSR